MKLSDEVAQSPDVTRGDRRVYGRVYDLAHDGVSLVSPEVVQTLWCLHHVEAPSAPGRVEAVLPEVAGEFVRTLVENGKHPMGAVARPTSRPTEVGHHPVPRLR